MKRYAFRLEHAEDHYIQASIETGRGRANIVNVYVPPQGSIHYNNQVFEKLSEVGADAVLAGDLIWVGTKSMQTVVQGTYKYDEENCEGKR